MDPSPETQVENRMHQGLTMQYIQRRRMELRNTIQRWLKDKEMKGDTNETNYIFLSFVVDHLPKGLIGLLIAVIFLSAWGTVAAAFNALSSATVNDIHKRVVTRLSRAKREYHYSQLYTLAWGIFCVVIAQLAYNIGNSLIEAVNVLGSLFYGVILGIFPGCLLFQSVSGPRRYLSAQ